MQQLQKCECLKKANVHISNFDLGDNYYWTPTEIIEKKRSTTVINCIFSLSIQAKLLRSFIFDTKFDKYYTFVGSYNKNVIGNQGMFNVQDLSLKILHSVCIKRVS